MQHTISHPKHHRYFDINFGPYNLGIRQWNAGVWCYYIEKNGKTNLPGFGQINRIEFQPGLAETTTLMTLPNQNFAPSECTPARWSKALLQPQSPNWCFGAAWTQVAILNSRVVFSGAKKQKLRFRSWVVAALQYFHTVNWINWAIMSCLLFPHHAVLPLTALEAQPTPLRSATLEHSNLQKKLPQKLAVMLFIANPHSKQPTWLITDMLERSSSST